MTNVTKRQSSLRGVNFGGWLIVEKWLTPGLFESQTAIDEWGLSQTKRGKQLITKHRDEFITESDFEWCRAHGITLIRLPVGYWLFDAIDGYVAQQKWVDWVFDMAEKYDLSILLDVHGVQGSQNGNEHSGRAGAIEWSKYTDQTMQLLDALAMRYGHRTALWGIELLNEPDSNIEPAVLTSFYQTAYDALVPKLRKGTYIVFHDSFRPFAFNGAIMAVASHPVIMDVHWYLFSSAHARYLPAAVLLKIVGLTYRIKLYWLQHRQPVIIGEWSSVLPQALFDRAPQARHNALLRSIVEMQQSVYSRAVASMYWNYKAEGRGMWNYRALVDDGVIESKITE